MATNDVARNEKKRTITQVDNDGDSSLPTPADIGQVLLSFGNIFREFPDILFLLLPYIADRVIFNSIAFSNKDMYTKSKAIQPPWPLSYKLPSDGSNSIRTWSPCGTRIACRNHDSNIVIFDQRDGPFRYNENNNNQNGWLAHYGDRYITVTDLKFSPDGSYLVSSGEDGFIRLWDNVTGNYEQLQEWNMIEEAGVEELINRNIVRISVSVSTCNKYIVATLQNFVFLKDVENRGKTIKSLLPTFAKYDNIENIVFSSMGRPVFISCWEKETGMCIKVWRPYLDDDDEDRLIIIWKQTHHDRGLQTIIFSHDRTMVAISYPKRSKGIVWSIDMDNNCLTHKSEIVGITDFCFTPDNKYIVCNTINLPKLWSIAENGFTNNIMHGLNQGNSRRTLMVKSFSPNNRQLIVWEPSCGYYITSYFME